MENGFLIGMRIFLRALEAKDAHTVVSWFHDPEVVQFVPGNFPLTTLTEEEAIQHLYKKKPPSEIVFGIVLKVDNSLVGVTGFDRIDWISRSARTSVLIGVKKYWNRGLGTEAKNLLLNFGFYQLNLHHLYTEILAYNERTIAACRKQGYKEGGKLREACFKNGSYHDILLMDLIREEWIQFHKESITKETKDNKITEVEGLTTE